VNIDLGAHIDGCIAVSAHTLVVGVKADNKVKGRKADVILAAHQASQAALRLLKNGKGNCDVTEAIQKIAESYKCKPIEGMMSHQLKQLKIDDEKTIIRSVRRWHKRRNTRNANLKITKCTQWMF
jgi:methionine aminopeptidase